MQEKYGFVYIWYDRKHKRYYVGCHWGYEGDGYICSSSNMKKAYLLRPQDFKGPRILARIYTDKKDLLEEEYKWLSMIKDEELGVKYYNLHNHHFSHWTSDNIKKGSIAEKISQSHKENPDWGKWNIGLGRSEETREKLRQKNLGKKQLEESSEKKREAMKKIWENGEFNISPTTYDKNRNKSEETRKKISENSKRLQAEGKVGTKGKKYSDESKAKMSEAQKECKKGVKWWTDGTLNKQSKECPGDGWYRGRTFVPSDDMIDKIQQKSYGRKASKETKSKLRHKHLVKKMKKIRAENLTRRQAD